MDPTVEGFRADVGPLVGAGQADLHHRDMTATFSADLSFGDAQQLLAAHDQWLPMDGDPAATLRELVEEDSTGPLRLGYGAWRDLLLGTQFCDGQGRLISAGGRVIKNVAGYDLTKFMVGSHGIFGRLVTLTVRSYRRPPGATVALFPPDLALLNTMLLASPRPQWAMIEPAGLKLGFLGDKNYLGFCMNRLAASRPQSMVEQSLESDISQRAELWRATGPIAFRASVPPSRLQEYWESAGLKSYVADGAFGVVLGGMTVQEEANVIAAASAVGGSLKTWESPAVAHMTEPARPRRALRHLSTNIVERRIIERLKNAFDPDATLPRLPWKTA